ncbi:MAG: hypothetical protein NVS9B10_10770 [Nevskia sp.]
MAAASLAFAILRHEWRRFLPGLLSVTFAGVLMLVQLGLLIGMFGTVTVLVDSAAADLWISSPATESVDQGQAIPGRLADLVRALPDVARSETLSLNDVLWHSARGAKLSVSLVGLTPETSALGCPQALRAALCAQLAEPMAVVVGAGDLDKLAVAPGETAEINGRRVRVIVAEPGLRNIGSAYVFASTQTARVLLDGSGGGDTTFVLARLQNAAPGAARDALQAGLIGPHYRVWTRAELSASSQRYWLGESGVGAGFLFSSLLGLVIGIVITSQTLRAAVLASVREYAALRAMGVSAGRLVMVVLHQALWIGFAGVGLTLLTSVLVQALAAAFDVTLVLSLWAILLAAGIGLATAALSGVLTLRELYRLEPAELLR